MDTKEFTRNVWNGWAMLAVLVVVLVVIVAEFIGVIFGIGYSFSHNVLHLQPLVVVLHLQPLVVLIPAFVVWIVLCAGFFTLEPNRGAVLILFGAYRGSVKAPGFKWANPFYLKRKVSLRWHNLNGEKLKVNELRGNPIEIAAIIVWRVVDTARAIFDVEDYDDFVVVQSEAAVRHLAMSYPYDTFEGDVLSLRGSPDEVSAALQKEVQERVEKAGVLIEETRLSHLAYAPEIAGAMLQRQQAEAVVAARTRIVDGAVGMVELAIDRLEHSDKVKLDEERKAAMISNLLVVLCAHEPALPIVNTGTLYPG